MPGGRRSVRSGVLDADIERKGGEISGSIGRRHSGGEVEVIIKDLMTKCKVQEGVHSQAFDD